MMCVLLVLCSPPVFVCGVCFLFLVFTFGVTRGAGDPSEIHL